MRRRLFTILSALSLLLCLATLSARVVVPRMPRDMFVERKITTLSDQSRVTTTYGVTGYGPRFDRDRELLPGMAHSRKVLPDYDRFGFRLYSGPTVCTIFAVYSGRNVIFQQQHDYLSLTLPYWAIALLALAFPLAYGSVFLRRLTRRRNDNTCRICSYNLTGNVSGICPECGSKIVTQ